MDSSRSFYRAVWVAGLVGAAWLGLCLFGHPPIAPCFFKAVSGWPCPGCGATRALLLFLQGEFGTAFMTNPVGPLLGFAGLTGFCLVLWDTLARRERLLGVYRAGESFLRKKKILWPLALLVFANWTWNIHKGL